MVRRADPQRANGFAAGDRREQRIPRVVVILVLLFPHVNRGVP
jgi:hypothetical protein